MPKTRQRRPKTTGTVIRDASGTWRARLNAPDGSRVSLGSFRTKTEAERALAVGVGEQSKNAWINPRSGRLTFATYAASWIDHRSGLRPRTVELYAYQLRVHLLPTFGDLALNEITAAHVRAWRSTLMKAAKPGPVTVSKVYRLLRAILNTTVEDELISKNPCTIKGAGSERSPERPIATVEQVDQLAARSIHVSGRSCTWPRTRRCVSANSSHCAAAASTSRPERSRSSSKCRTLPTE